MEPAAPAPINDLLASFDGEMSFMVTAIQWHCGKVTGLTEDGKKVVEPNVVLTLTGKPVGTYDETTRNFFFDHEGATTLLEAAIAMNIHQAKHERGAA